MGQDLAFLQEVSGWVMGAAKVPVWAKLTPSTTDIVEEARAAFRGGADAISSSNTFPLLPLIDPDSLEFGSRFPLVAKTLAPDGYVPSDLVAVA